MRRKSYNYREFAQILVKNGYVMRRYGKGDHVIWRNPTTGKRIIVNAVKLNICVANRLIKEYDLEV